MARKEANETSDREIHNVYSSMYIKLSSMWRKRNDVYVEQLSATKAHKSEDFQTARRWLRNDVYKRQQNAINSWKVV